MESFEKWNSIQCSLTPMSWRKKTSKETGALIHSIFNHYRRVNLRNKGFFLKRHWYHSTKNTIWLSRGLMEIYSNQLTKSTRVRRKLKDRDWFNMTIEFVWFYRIRKFKVSLKETFHSKWSKDLSYTDY